MKHLFHFNRTASTKFLFQEHANNEPNGPETEKQLSSTRDFLQAINTFEDEIKDYCGHNISQTMIMLDNALYATDVSPNTVDDAEKIIIEIKPKLDKMYRLLKWVEDMKYNLDGYWTIEAGDIEAGYRQNYEQGTEARGAMFEIYGIEQYLIGKASEFRYQGKRNE